MIEMSRFTATLLMHWQITFLSHNTSSAFSTDAFTKLKSKMLTFHLKVYNMPFCMEELQEALRRAHNTSAGPDEIHYHILKHLPKSSLLLLLNIFNKIWISDDFPSDWRKAIIIPVTKFDKDPTNPTNYYLIALTSCMTPYLQILRARLHSTRHNIH